MMMMMNFFGASSDTAWSVFEVCADYGGVNVFHVSLNFSGIYGVGVCVNVCVFVCSLFLTSECCLLCCECVRCCDFCLICDACSWRCSFMGSVMSSLTSVMSPPPCLCSLSVCMVV